MSDEGKITINGKEIKKIMVDGKEFFSDDPKVSMKNLPANMIEKVKAYDKKVIWHVSQELMMEMKSPSWI